jgi:uncharacterized membrane protein
VKWIIKISVFVFIAWGSYYLTILATPYSVLTFLKLKNKSEFNQPVYADIITDKDRQVVLPNPDFLYIVSGYNLRKGPIKISGRMPDSSYYSVAFYEMNTQNFYIKNDRETPSKNYELILATPEQRKSLKETNLEIIEAPTYAGAILVRILVTDNSQIPYLKEIQHSFKIEEITIASKNLTTNI